MQQLRPGEAVVLPKIEEEILGYWDKIDAFQESLRRTEGLPEFSFFDGPPFATGLPHYGHLLAGTIKDIVTRYWSLNGFHVTRRFGWDTHGLPVEHEVDKMLGIKSPEDVEKMGIDKYNATCRGIVMRYSKEWEHTVKRCGRWIDFENDYKTLNPSFMETEWWVFSQLWEKGLVYSGVKVMPYSIGCATPLSNFEANSNYKEVYDNCVVVGFRRKDKPDHEFVAWTTTPWTLPSNLGLVVNADMEYVTLKCLATGRIYTLMKGRESEVFPPQKGKPSKDQYEVLETCKGSDLVGIEYEPLFPYFSSFGAEDETLHPFRVVADPYVTSDSGTGIVHCAPYFGEDDYRVGLANGIIKKDTTPVCPVDDVGCLAPQVTDFAGLLVTDPETNKKIIAHLKEKGKLIRSGTVKHKYPYCWRSDTPLIYKAVPSWFVRVEQVKDRLIANNASPECKWVPTAIQEKRFHNWLANARDWAISRNRFWGTPIPVWQSEDGTQSVCIGSIAQLEELRLKGEGVDNTPITDLHRDKIDSILIPDPRGPTFPPMHRIKPVFDCWFESGSMPYAQRHYPFENKEAFEKTFPADFIAEGLDQTRGWFYTLLILSTILFDTFPARHVIVNGLILAADGEKMSKSKRNYPDPSLILDKYGADALRLYLINSPAVRADPLLFNEKGVEAVARDVLVPLVNVYRFFLENVERYERTSGNHFKYEGNVTMNSSKPHALDLFLRRTQDKLIEDIRKEMEVYHLYSVLPKILTFVDHLSRWYIRLDKGRGKGERGIDEQLSLLHTLYDSLLCTVRVLSPFCPFITEWMYQNLRKAMPEDSELNVPSVHFLRFPEVSKHTQSAEEEKEEKKLVEGVECMFSVINVGRAARSKGQISLKLPLRCAHVCCHDAEMIKALEDEALLEYIRSELNVLSVELTTDEAAFATLSLKPSYREIGAKFGKGTKAVIAALPKLSQDEIRQFRKEGHLLVAGEYDITLDECSVVFQPIATEREAVSASEGGLFVELDIRTDHELVTLGLRRFMRTAVQQLRKASKCSPSDKCVCLVVPPESYGETGLDGDVFEEACKYVAEELKANTEIKVVDVEEVEKRKADDEKKSEKQEGVCDYKGVKAQLLLSVLGE